MQFTLQRHDANYHTPATNDLVWAYWDDPELKEEDRWALARFVEAEYELDGRRWQVRIREEHWEYAQKSPDCFFYAPEAMP